MIKIKFTCEYCGVEGERRKSDYNRAKHHYCSHKCSVKASDSIVYTECAFCRKQLILKRNKVRAKARVFCSHSCASKMINVERGGKLRKGEINCSYCGKKLAGEQFKYCSISCQHQHIYSNFIKAWQDGIVSGSTANGGVASTIRKYLHDKYGCRCAICGWNKINPHTHKIPLQVHHIDGNSHNASEDNLILICPNCHSLTDKFGARNKGNGRDSRRIRRANQK